MAVRAVLDICFVHGGSCVCADSNQRKAGQTGYVRCVYQFFRCAALLRVELLLCNAVCKGRGLKAEDTCTGDCPRGDCPDVAGGVSVHGARSWPAEVECDTIVLADAV